jgi:hypothetical protein
MMACGFMIGEDRCKRISKGHHELETTEKVNEAPRAHDRGLIWGAHAPSRALFGALAENL